MKQSNSRSNPIRENDLGVSLETASYWYEDAERERTFPIKTVEIEGGRIRATEAEEFAERLLELAEDKVAE